MSQKSEESPEKEPTPSVTPSIDSIKDAKEAGLKYVLADELGIRRRRKGRGFVYEDARGKRIEDPSVLERIRHLAIPPAWESVWICAHAKGHLQAVGKDARGRRQYLYHPAYREARDHNKFNRLISFGACLPSVRQTVSRDLRRAGSPKRKILAAMVRLLDTTCVRVGNVEYARTNNSYGLTTLKAKHVTVVGATVHLKFRGKSGIEQELSIKDSKLAAVIRTVLRAGRKTVFQYRTETGDWRPLSAADVNEYLRHISGDDFTAKDFRTWHGTSAALSELLQAGPADSKTDAKRRLSQAVKATAGKLGNRPATCRSYYIHPAIIESYLDKRLFRAKPELEGRALRVCETMMLVLVKRIHRPHVNLAMARAS